ncbi:MAG: putative nucleic acid-binding Zn-ribbon protein [Flavobacteriales bacterium]|jgi:predicted  nucleic acid-binding Zn-ribbon protein|tara:strand:- start:1329 stop:2087 length:759 start_codon:yes stop_codon:yes gene_type:complete
MAKAKEIKVEDKLKALYKLQLVDSKIDKIRIVRGELPLEVQDLEDDVAGLQTRIDKINEEISDLDNTISGKKNLIIDAETGIEKYKGQQNNVRNNREYDSLSKEIEFQTLEIELANKRIKEAKIKLDGKKDILTENETKINARQDELKLKQDELESIVNETEKEEKALEADSVKAEALIDDRLVIGYKRVRNSVRNGLAVVSVERESCGGCFNKIPPQRQLEISLRKKVIVCEHCGRILVDPDLAEAVAEKA